MNRKATRIPPKGLPDPRQRTREARRCHRCGDHCLWPADMPHMKPVCDACVDRSGSTISTNTFSPDRKQSQ